MGIIVVFNYQSWVARYPEFANVPEAAVDGPNGYFYEATAYIRNDGFGPINNVVVKTVLLNAATAHICKLYAMLDGQASPQTVGRISSATEGSVSVQLQMDGSTQASSWWQQTKYGAAVWQLLAPYRTMRYIPGPQRQFDPAPVPYGGYQWMKH